MRALAANVAQGLGTVAVDLDPEHVEAGDLAQDLEITLGLGVEVEVEQHVDVGSGAIAQRFQVHAQVAQHGAIHVELGIERRTESRPPALGVLGPLLVHEDVGLHGREALLAHLGAHRFHAIEVGDGGLVPARMIDAPRRAVRPVHANPITHLATEQLVAGHAQPLGLGVDQCVLDGTHSLRHHAAGTGARGAVELGIDALMLADRLPHHARRQVRNHGADARRAEALVELAPADDAAIGRELDEMIVAPARVAGERLDARHFHCCFLRLFPDDTYHLRSQPSSFACGSRSPARHSRERASAVQRESRHWLRCCGWIPALRFAWRE